MKSRCESISFSQVVKSTLCLIATVVVAWPVVAQQYTSWLRGALRNAQNLGVASLEYASDWNERLPRLDNNGSCAYGETPCNYPDWGMWAYPNENIAYIEAGVLVMYAGAVGAYMKDPIPSDPSMGHTSYSRAFSLAFLLGITPPNTPYNPDFHHYYRAVSSQFGINIMTIDWGSRSASSFNNRPLAPKGRLSMFAHPETTILASMESAWDWDKGASINLGDPGVWPSSAGEGCWSRTSDGWTRYSIPKPGQDPRLLQGNGMGAYGHPDRAKLNPNLRGLAMFLFADGHAEALSYLESERCTPVPNGGSWVTNGNGATNTLYYPNWVPEIAP